LAAVKEAAERREAAGRRGTTPHLLGGGQGGGGKRGGGSSMRELMGTSMRLFGASLRKGLSFRSSGVSSTALAAGSGRDVEVGVAGVDGEESAGGAGWLDVKVRVGGQSGGRATRDQTQTGR